MSEYKIIIERDENIIFEKEIDADQALDFILQKVDAINSREEKPFKEKKKYKKRKIKDDFSTDSDDLSERPGRAKKILPEDISRMKDMINEGQSVQSIAEEFGVSNQTVYVLKRKMQEAIV